MSRRSRRDEYRRTGRKPQKEEALNIDKDMLLKVGIGVVVAAVIAIGALIWHYNIPTVARVDGVRLDAEDVARHMRGAEDILVWDYTARYPGEIEIDYDRQFDGGRTFGRTIREEAVRMAALTNMYQQYADELGITFWGTESLDQIMSMVTEEILMTPEVFARFEPYIPDTGVEPTDNRAQEILERAHAGEDFDMLIEMYGEDPGMVGNPDGYTFVSGVMVAEFEQATRELAIGEISGLVPSQFGYHIIKRVEPNPDDVMGDWSGDDEELLAAKHILISRADDVEFVDNRRDAIALRFGAMLDNADLVFLGALDDVPLAGEQ